MSIFFYIKLLGGVNIKQELPINEKIRLRKVQDIDKQGQKLGIMSSESR